MRRFLTILTMMCLSLTLWADNGKTQESRKEIYVIRTLIQNKEIMRDISSSVKAYINHDAGMLELECYGIGDADVYIIDSNNQVIDQIILFDGTPTAFLPIPEEPGNYVLVIWSDKYYGEGEFIVE